MRILRVLLYAYITLVSIADCQDVPRALPDGELPDDARLQPLRTLNDYFPFKKVESREAWADRAAALRRQVLVATGLWPLPNKTPLNAVIHGRVERDDYTVERVYFESFPGHYVSGSLYRPKEIARGQRVPGILSPHGHWSNGRFHDHGDAQLKKELASGAEAFDSGRHPLQARCAHLARLGCVVFHYDMIGYADSQQLKHRESHLLNGAGLYGMAAELRQQNAMGIQTYNSIRALDFIESLPDVDTERLGVTGASGGGTQTFILGAVDDRPQVLFPAVMVSTAMQGGCQCENANYLRVGAGNIDIAALAAPRPLGMTGADDWTIEIATKGGPDLKQLYTMLGASQNVTVAPFLQYGHNYNAVSRQAMAHFFNDHFQLGHEEPISERDFEPLSREELTVWTDAHPAPKSRGANHERVLLDWWGADSDLQISLLEARLADSASALETYDNVVGGGWASIIGRSLDEVGPIDYALVAKEERSTHLIMSGLLTATAHHEQVPALFLFPGKDSWNGQVVLSVHSLGKAIALFENGQPRPEIESLIGKGFAVMAIDVFGTGEFTRTDQPLTTAPLNGDDGNQRWRQYAGYTYGYNRPVFCKRVHDVLTAIAYVTTTPQWDVRGLHLLGADNGGALIALAAATQAPDAIDRIAIDISETLRFEMTTALDNPWFVPGSVKYRDIDGLVALCAPTPVLLSDNGSVKRERVEPRFRAFDAADRLVFPSQIDSDTLCAWFTDQE